RIISRRRRSLEKDEAGRDKEGPKKLRWTNKQRVLIFCARGITHRPRHLMNDLCLLLPHSKADAKLYRKDKLFVVNEVCDLKNCNKCKSAQIVQENFLFNKVRQGAETTEQLLIRGI
ncbi:ribosome biogenesis protein BRX1 homolog, partial [Oscarella lobularis]|uniref:ribosome biogenesis protein BRX1 homolog n=1 Tax=Oscarella lobularis TaxID=121494 RepID=UPI003313C2DA